MLRSEFSIDPDKGAWVYSAASRYAHGPVFDRTLVIRAMDRRQCAANANAPTMFAQLCPVDIRRCDRRRRCALAGRHRCAADGRAEAGTVGNAIRTQHVGGLFVDWRHGAAGRRDDDEHGASTASAD
jgi:hypothetical protein